MKIILGTAAAGMSYGVSNPTEKMAADAAMSLLDAAWAAGITCLDTAAAYGDAEDLVGRWVRAVGRQPEIYTKIMSGTASSGEPDENTSVLLRRSLERIGQPMAAGIMTHRVADYLDAGVRKDIFDAKRQGLARTVGLSVYDPEEVFEALEHQVPDFVQLPLSVLDTRMHESGAIAACRSAGVSVHIRSIFLQGALLMAPGALPSNLKGLIEPVMALGRIASKHERSVLELLLWFPQCLADADALVVGVYDERQLRDIVGAAASKRPGAGLISDLRQLGRLCSRRDIDPRCW